MVLRNLMKRTARVEETSSGESEVEQRVGEWAWRGRAGGEHGN